MSQQPKQSVDASKKDQAKKKAVIPKKSSSVLVCRRNISKQKDFDYEFLMLRRNPKLPFGGMHSFPGGNMDKEDSAFTSERKEQNRETTQLLHDWQDTLIYTGIRELFEEIGVVVAKRNQEDVMTKLIQADQLKFEDIYHATKPDLRNICIPFLRIITIQTVPRRWDTQFFIVEVDSNGKSLDGESICLFNILKYQKTKDINDLYDLNDLVLGQDESDTFSWETPLSALKQHAEKKIKLPVPQLLICNLMISFQSVKQIKGYFQQINEQHTKYSKQREIDYLRANPSTFPIILDIKSSEGKRMKLTMCGDEEYPIQKILDGEEECPFKQELNKAYKSVQVKKGQSINIVSDFSTDMQATVNCDFLAPLTLLRPINLQNINSEQITPKL